MQLNVHTYDFFSLIYEIGMQMHNLNSVSTLLAIISIAVLTFFYIMKGKKGSSSLWNYGPIFCIALATIVNGTFRLDLKYSITTPGEVT